MGKQEQFKINNQIRVPEVRLTGEDVDPGIYDIKTALRLSNDLGLDLVLITENSNPPVCKVIDYKKFLYERKRKLKNVNGDVKEVKEIRLTPNTDFNDLNTKIKHTINFLTNGHKVKVSVFFKGREIDHLERGELIALKVADSIIAVGKADALPKREGKRIIMMLSPTKKQKLKL